MRFSKHIGDALVFVRLSDGVPSLDDFVGQLFKRLGIASMRGYVSQGGEEGYVGCGGGIEFNVSEIDEREDCSYQFVIYLKPEVAFGDTDYLVEHARNLAKRWSQTGWSCFVPREGLYQITNDTDGTIYAA